MEWLGPGSWVSRGNGCGAPARAALLGPCITISPGWKRISHSTYSDRISPWRLLSLCDRAVILSSSVAFQRFLDLCASTTARVRASEPRWSLVPQKLFGQRSLCANAKTQQTWLIPKMKSRGSRLKTQRRFGGAKPNIYTGIRSPTQSSQGRQRRSRVELSTRTGNGLPAVRSQRATTASIAMFSPVMETSQPYFLTAL